MKLVTKNKKANGTFRYKFIDIFVCGQSENVSNSNVVLELKVASLLGLHRGKLQKPEKDINISLGKLIQLNDEIKTKSEEDLLKLDYCYFCKESNKYQFITVQKILDDGIKQINGYMELVKSGRVCDDNVKAIEGLNYKSSRVF